MFLGDIIFTKDTVQSIRGRSKYIFDGYLYVRQKEFAKGVEEYECEKQRRNILETQDSCEGQCLCKMC